MEPSGMVRSWTKLRSFAQGPAGVGAASVEVGSAAIGEGMGVSVADGRVGEGVGVGLAGRSGAGGT